MPILAGAGASGAAACGLSSCGSQALELMAQLLWHIGLAAACGIFPDQGSDPNVSCVGRQTLYH